MKINHIGYAVKNMTLSVQMFNVLGFSLEGNEVIDNNRDVIIQLMKNGEYIIELVSPLNEQSPINNILKKNGNIPYHLCYETLNVEETIKELELNHFILIHDEMEAPALDDKTVVFLYHKDVGIIEVVSR